MKESVQAAESYVKSRAVVFGIRRDLFGKRDIHVHVPEGATPKDGPSAGVAMVTSIVSVLTGIPVRRDVAMTGEITLARPGPADRRPQGEAAGGSAGRVEDGFDPERQRKGPRRDPGQREEGTSDHSGQLWRTMFSTMR